MPNFKVSKNSRNTTLELDFLVRTNKTESCGPPKKVKLPRPENLLSFGVSESNLKAQKKPTTLLSKERMTLLHP